MTYFICWLLLLLIADCDLLHMLVVVVLQLTVTYFICWMLMLIADCDLLHMLVVDVDVDS